MFSTSYDISKKLQEIGFKAETDLVWCKDFDDEGNCCIRSSEAGYDVSEYYETIPAYELETLLRVLPMEIPHINSKKLFGMLVHLGIRFIPKNNTINIGYSFGSFEFIETKSGDESLADMAAKLLIKLIENKLMNYEHIPL